MPEAASKWTTSGSSSGAAPAGPDAPDPFGVRPAYAVRAGGRAHAGDDPRALRRLPGAPRGIDAAGLYGYLCFSHVPEPRTLFAGVERLPTPAPWRESPVADADEDAAVRRLRDLLRASVARMLTEDRSAELAVSPIGRRAGSNPPASNLTTDSCHPETGPAGIGEHVEARPAEGSIARSRGESGSTHRDAGVYLSGGLDSSLVAALLVEAGARVHLFSLDFGPPFDVELEHAEAVAAHLGRPLHRVRARPRDVSRALEPTVAALHQPFGDPVTVPLYLLGQAARDHVSVVFNGEGGDQLFGGWATKPMIAAEAYGGAGYSRESAYLATYHRFHGAEDRLLTPAARERIGEMDAGAWLRPALDAPHLPSLLHRLRAANLRLKGAQNIAPRMTQLAAAHGLEARAPFFDRALAEWTFTLPADFFLRGASEKHLLKRAAEDLLPPALIDRPKRGMGVPATEWLRGWLSPLRWEAARRLSSRRLKRDGWFRSDYVAALRRGDDDPGETRRRRAGEKLWALLVLHLWLDAQDPPLDWRIA